MKTDIFYITTGMGKTQQWAEIAELAVHADNLNDIGYSGEFNNEKMWYGEYFNKFVNTDTVSFAIHQTKHDNGDFSERFTLSRTIIEKKVRNTAEQLRTAHKALMLEASANICDILKERGILRMFATIGREYNRSVLEVCSDGTTIAPEKCVDVKTEKVALCDLGTEELYSLLECVEKSNYEILELKIN